MDRLRWINLWLTGTGTAVFWLLSSVVLFAPATFDNYAKDFAVSEVASRLGGLGRDPVGEGNATGVLPDRVREHLPGDVRNRLSSLERLLTPEVEAFVNALLMEACKLDCSRRGDVSALISSVFKRLRADLASARSRIRSFVLEQFDEVLGEVRRDVTIFTLTMSGLFLAAFLLGVLKRRASGHLFPLSVGLSTITLFMGAWYVFGQDWLLTVIFSDYWGLAYPAAATLLACFLLDIAFFRARITSNVINAVANTVGSTVSVSPC